jgi:ribosomal protein S18 acetylase RimI-like enzyme
LYRFWPGVPTDLEHGALFFQSLGFELSRGTFDLVRSLAGWDPPDRVRRDMKRAGVEIGPARREEVPDVLRFEQVHFPFWLDNFRTILGLGGEEEIVVAREKGGEIVGTLCSYSPASRFRSANLVWETLLGGAVGGLGSVGVAESRRGRGIGLALCAEAMRLLEERGAGQCHVDWTGHVDFYGKLGFRVWREYWMGGLPAQKA